MSSSTSKEESDELARFRAEWKAEVERRRQQLAGQSSASPSGQQVAQEKPGVESQKNPLLNRPATRATPGAAIPTSGKQSGLAAQKHPAIRDGALLSASKSPALSNALAIYKKAVTLEQSGDLDGALASYRQAFRLDPNVDRAFQRDQREELIRTKLQDYAEKVAPHGGAPSSPESLANEFQKLSVQQVAGVPSKQASKLLAQIIEAFPPDLKFEPEEEKLPVYFNDLPIEIMYLILRKLGVANLERFALVCRRARILTLDPVYWSDLVRRTYKPPQLASEEVLLEAAQKYQSNFRQLYIEQPRVRMDGLYIAMCHYTRPGLSENSWVNVNHLITYYRYLRFYPNGQVLSLLANEEMSPEQVIPIIKPTLRMKGFFMGNWYLTDTTLSVVNLMDASGRYFVPGHDDVTMVASNISTLRPSLDPASTSGTSTPTGCSGTVNGASSGGHSTTQPGPSSTRGRGGYHGHGGAQGHSGSANASAPQPVRHLFDMTLALRSKPMGRWNKLEWLTYDSVNLETQDVHAIPLKHEKPFWFSKVRSYA